MPATVIDAITTNTATAIVVSAVDSPAWAIDAAAAAVRAKIFGFTSDTHIAAVAGARVWVHARTPDAEKARPSRGDVAGGHHPLRQGLDLPRAGSLLPL